MVGMTTDIEIRRSSRRSIIMSMAPDGHIVVKAPRLVPLFVIRRFVESHKEWIEKQNKLISAIPKDISYVHGEKILYLGKECVLDIGPYKEISAVEEKLQFPRSVQFRIKTELGTWYKKQAKDIICGYVESLSLSMHVSYSGVYFSDTSSKWASCSHDNRLQFSWRLVMAPPLVIRYVVIHELSHIVHKNHSRAFWSLVSRFNPSYKQQIKWLKSNGMRIHAGVE